MAMEATNMLKDYATGRDIRPATREEWSASVEAAHRDGGAGVIDVDGRACYVEGEVFEPSGA